MRKLLKELHRFSFNFLSMILGVFPDTVIGNSLRGRVLGAYFRRRGGNLQISRGVHILYPERLVVGDDVFIGYGAWINCQGLVTLGDEVMLGPYVIIASGNHTAANGSYRFGPHSIAPVVVGRGAWVAGGASLMPGAQVGVGVVLAAGAVLLGEAVANSIYGGVPAVRKGGDNVKN